MKKIITEFEIYIERLEDDIVIGVTGFRTNDDVNIGEEFIQIDRLGFPKAYPESSFTPEELDRIEEAAYQSLFEAGQPNEGMDN